MQTEQGTTKPLPHAPGGAGTARGAGSKGDTAMELPELRDLTPKGQMHPGQHREVTGVNCVCGARGMHVHPLPGHSALELELESPRSSCRPHCQALLGCSKRAVTRAEGMGSS